MPIKEAPNVIGARSEACVLAALLRAGYQVLVPYGVARYDLALDLEGTLHRIQVKTGRLRDGVVIYNVKSCSPGTRNKTMRYTADEIDSFGVYCPTLDACYLVPIAEAGGGYLRVDPTRNNNRTNVRLAADYLLRPAA